LFEAASMVQQVALRAELSSRFARVEPSPDARGEYIRAATWLSVGLSIAGEKVAARAFLTRVRGMCEGGDRTEVDWAYLRGAESMAQYLLEDAPWAGMLSLAEGARLLSMTGRQRTHSFVCNY